MTSGGDEGSFATDASRLLEEAAQAAVEWRERTQNAFGGASTEETLLDSDTFLGRLEGIIETWAGLSPPAAEVEAYAQVSNTLDGLKTRLEELITALESTDFERVRIAAQSAEMSVQRLQELRGSVGAAGS